MPDSGTLSGLTTAQASSRLAQEGPNDVPEPQRHPLLRFAAKFWGMSAWMLELIAVLSLLLHKLSDFWIAVALLFINATLAFLQEQRASAAVAALRGRMRVSSRVLRDGAWQLIAARELVRDDVVRVRAGDFVPADLDVAEGVVAVDESTLTGESQAVRKAAGDSLFSGATIRNGEATCVVTATGTSTFYGRTTQLVASASPKLHVEEVVSGVVRRLFGIVGLLVIAIVVVAIARQLPLFEVLPLALVLLMSAVPVALPVMFTVSMAVGARELARRGVIVTRLSAAEDAASMDVLCVDKTGTITENRLSVNRVFPADGITDADVLRAGALASREDNQDPIDLAFIAAARQHGATVPTASVVPGSFVPFDATSRRTEALAQAGDRRFRVSKGSARAIADLCGLSTQAIEALEARVAAIAADGFRALAVASGPEHARPTFMGLVALSDPPRQDAGQLIETLRRLGVSVKMLTGDALAIAQQVGRGVGLTVVRRLADVSGGAAQGTRISAASLEHVDGLAEIYPEHKYEVVRTLQATGHVVGMTGDGVNDAPALRQAEVGVAVAGAVDVAKSAASVVLTDLGLVNIVSLVEQGRTIYQRILTWVINKISRTILKAVFVVAAFAVTGKFVVSAFAMLLLVFMTDFAKIALATDSARPSARPETWNIRGYVIAAVVIGCAMSAEALCLLWFGWTHFGLAVDDKALHTFSFVTLLYFAVFSIVSVRERRWFWQSAPAPTLLAALAADVIVGTALAYSGAADLAPLPWSQTLAALCAAAASCLVVNDAVKVLLLRRLVPAAG